MKFWLSALVAFAFYLLEACDFGSTSRQRADDDNYSSFAWVKYPDNPVFVKSPPGHWDSDWITCFSVRKIGATYWMYYSARRDSSRPLQIGVATSTDGINWTRYPDSILSPGPRGAWDDKVIYGPDVVFHNGEFLMYYVGQSNSGGCGIGMATSVDGFHWQKQGNAPVIASGACLSVDKDGDSLIMLYMGSSGFGRASSLYGQNWILYSGNPVFPPGDTTQWDEIIASPSLVILNGNYHLWYTGADTVGNARGKIQIGWATSTDRGCFWSRFPGNPVLTPTQPWEGKCLYTNNAVMSTTLYQMWYGSAGFGYAYNDVTSIEEPLIYKKQSTEIRIYPNPLRCKATIKFNIGQRAKDVEQGFNLAIYDASGRLVKTFNLTSNFYPLASISWDGTDDTGKRLPPGVYFVRVELEEKGFIGKFTIAR